jgi:hypothetical protein
MPNTTIATPTGFTTSTSDRHLSVLNLRRVADRPGGGQGGAGGRVRAAEGDEAEVVPAAEAVCGQPGYLLPPIWAHPRLAHPI